MTDPNTVTGETPWIRCIADALYILATTLSPGTFHYFRPDGVSTYFRPDGSSTYLRR